MHSTSNLEDGYMGSGKRLRYSIRKYGVETFTKEIIEFLDDRDSLAKREAEIVNEELINDPLCMNLKCGGNGGFSNEEHRKKCSTAGNAAYALRYANDSILQETVSSRMSLIMKELHKQGRIKYDTFTGKQHSEESKRLIGDKNSIKQKGSGNSQFGTVWITNQFESIKIKKEKLDSYISLGYIRGRKYKG